MARKKTSEPKADDVVTADDLVTEPTDRIEEAFRECKYCTADVVDGVCVNCSRPFAA